MKTVSERNWFFSQEKIAVEMGAPSLNTEIYRLATTGQTVCDIRISFRNDGQETIIAACADLHFNLCNKEDAEDEETNYTEKCRLWQANGKSVPQACKSMEIMEYADAAVICGDIMDYLSRGCIELMNNVIVKRYPEYILTPGGHELTKQMQTKLPNKLSLEERVALVEAAWPHDMHYVSRDVGDKAIAVAIDNGQQRYLECQIEKLEADIRRAREEGRVLIIFQHEPINSGNPDDVTVPAVIFASGAYKEINFKDGSPIGDFETCDAATRKIYRLICDNADVVKAVVAGHWHSQFYGEIAASYERDGERVPAVIPQYVIYGNPYLRDGYTARIIID